MENSQKPRWLLLNIESLHVCFTAFLQQPSALCSFHFLQRISPETSAIKLPRQMFSELDHFSHSALRSCVFVQKLCVQIDIKSNNGYPQVKLHL